jgi:hypothetical protein
MVSPSISPFMRRTDRVDNRNHHADALMMTRTIGPRGLGEEAQIEWSDGNRRKAGLGPAKQEILLVRARERHSRTSTSSLGIESTPLIFDTTVAALPAIESRMLNAR